MSTPTDDPCANCGECCSRQGTPPFLHTPDDRPPPHLEWDIDQHADRYDRGLPCLWYSVETKRCNHYEFRPLVCREFTPGEPACNDFRGRVGLPLLPAVEVDDA
jgi:uncharacterized protein